jgi:hypothetical protein
MSPVFKFILFVIIFLSVAIAGFLSFRILNKRIKESKTGWQLSGYSLLLFLVNAILFVGGLIVLIKSYDFLVNAE